MSLVVIGASANIARAAQSISDEVIFVQKPGTLDPGTLRDDVDDLFTLDFTEPALLSPFAERILRPRQVSAVVSVTEQGLEPAAILSEIVGTPATPLDVVRRFRNKLAMRQALADRAGHLTVDYADPRDPDAVKRLFSAHRTVIAKPVYGTASAGIYLFRSIADVARLPVDEPYLLEAFVPGPEFSVESFSRDGTHEIVAVAEKGTADNFVEVSHLVPPATLDAAGIAQVGRAVADLFGAVGLRDGPAHTEVKLHDGRVTVIETHNRPGGDGIADLVAATTGVDWRSTSVGWPLGHRPVRRVRPGLAGSASAAAPAAPAVPARPARPARPAVPAAANLFFTAPPGTVTRIVDRPADTPDVRVVLWEVDVGIGDTVGELRSSADRLGMASITGTSARACQRFLADVRHDGVVLTEGTPSCGS